VAERRGRLTAREANEARASVVALPVQIEPAMLGRAMAETTELATQDAALSRGRGRGGGVRGGGAAGCVLVAGRHVSVEDSAPAP